MTDAGYTFDFEKKELTTNIMEYIDLGLPSGTLWAESNEDEFYTFDEAVEKYGDSLPTKEQWEDRIAIPFLEESDYPTEVLSEIDTKKCTINNSSSILIENVKPYLRPMESMTVEERQEYGLVLCGELSINQFDWLNAHHFDHRGLIPMGLALEAPEGMYNN